jgi:hypothetical protein
MHLMRTLQKSHRPHTHLHDRDFLIDLVRPYVDATTAPDNAIVLHMLNITRPPSRPRCTMLSRLAVVEALETTLLHHEPIHWSFIVMHTSKIDAPKKGMT